MIRIAAKFNEKCLKIAKVTVCRILTNNSKQILQNFAWIFRFEWCNGVTILQISTNAADEYLLAKIGADTAENEPSTVRSFG